MTTTSSSWSLITRLGVSAVLLFAAFRFLQLAFDIGVGLEFGLVLLLGGGVTAAVSLFKRSRIRHLRRLLDNPPP